MSLITRLPHQLHQTRTFINARIKWVPDPYLDTAVQLEKNLKQILSLKNQILSSPTKSLPLSSLSLLKPHLHLPTTAAKFFQKYPSLFTHFQPSPSLPLHVKLTPQFLSLHKEESTVHSSPHHRHDLVQRLSKLLMLTRSTKLPIHVIDKLKFDLGLPHNYITTLLADYPEYFQVCSVIDCLTNKETLALELVSWRNELAVSAMQKRVSYGVRIRFPMSLPRGFDLEKKVLKWVDEFQDLPYISPYQNAFNLGATSDQAEKWAVAVLHELLWILVSKKTEKENVFCLGQYLGFGDRFGKVLKHHPGIFYVSNKIRTQTVVLREAYRKDFLVEKHPLMGMRYRYIHLMNKEKNRRKSVGGGLAFRGRRNVALDSNKGKDRKEDGDIAEGEEEESDSVFEDVGNDETVKIEV